ncbi:MAG: FtsQ-type POTRA domain-containing protein [bacterium]|nr:FtsQ-type POTRA domain-containing protein [bacterium]
MTPTSMPSAPSPEPRRRPGADVVFAVRRAAPPRRRFPWRRVLAGTVIVGGLGAAGWWLAGSGTFAVARVGTGDYRFTDERALRGALATLLGRNLWTLGEGDVRQALAELPWIREAHVQRRLPASVDVELIEWRPLLVVAEPGAPPGAPALVLVEDGRVLPFPTHLPAPDLPVLTGIVVERQATGPARLPSTLAPSVLELVEALESSGLEAATTVDFVVSGPDGYGVVLRGREATLLVGREGFAERLTRYLTARAHVDSNLVIDLRFRDRLTVRPQPTIESEAETATDDEDSAARQPDVAKEQT